MNKEIILNSRVLIVDDQPANVLLLEQVLKQGGYRSVTTLIDPREVLNEFRIFQPDLILLDLMMPNMDGYAVIKQLAGWMPDDAYIPILVITADGSKAARQRALSTGAKDFLTKPIDNAEALLRVYNLLETRWLHYQLKSLNQRLSGKIQATREQLRAACHQLEHFESATHVPSAQLASLRSRVTKAAEVIEQVDTTVEL